MEAIVLAGGLGTRLQPVISAVPKPMAPVAGKPFLHYILDWLEGNQISRTILAVGYQYEIIQNAFGNRFSTMELAYSTEDSPLGTGGAIARAMEELSGEQFFIINGDTIFSACLSKLFAFHQAHAYDLSVLLKPMRDFDRYGAVEINEQNRIVSIKEKKPQKEGLINGGVYMANKQIKSYFPKTDAFSFEKEFLETKLNELSFGGLISDSYFIDIGIPSDYLKAQSELTAKS